jgi:hypothetical protein
VIRQSGADRSQDQVAVLSSQIVFDSGALQAVQPVHTVETLDDTHATALSTP